MRELGIVLQQEQPCICISCTGRAILQLFGPASERTLLSGYGSLSTVETLFL